MSDGIVSDQTITQCLLILTDFSATKVVKPNPSDTSILLEWQLPSDNCQQISQLENLTHKCQCEAHPGKGKGPQNNQN